MEFFLVARARQETRLARAASEEPGATARIVDCVNLLPLHLCGILLGRRKARTRTVHTRRPRNLHRPWLPAPVVHRRGEETPLEAWKPPRMGAHPSDSKATAVELETIARHGCTCCASRRGWDPTQRPADVPCAPGGTGEAAAGANPRTWRWKRRLTTTSPEHTNT